MGKKQTDAMILNMQGQLNALGIRLETISRLKFNNKRIDTVGIEYRSVLQDLDTQQNCSRYKWKGKLTNLILPSWLIEFMLYRCGNLAGFESGGIPYILPFAQAKGINIYGIQNAIQPITFNGVVINKPNNFGVKTYDINKPEGACILYDKIPVYSTNTKTTSRAGLNNVLIEYQAEVLGRVRNNLKNLDKKVVFWVDDEKQANQMKCDLREAYGTDDPFIVAVKGTQLRDKDNTTLQGDVANETQSLFETWQSINSIRCMCSGISNDGAFEKKERKITGELQGGEEQTDLVLDAGLEMRKLFIKQMQLIYPNSEWWKDLTVEINEEKDFIVTYGTFEEDSKKEGEENE